VQEDAYAVCRYVRHYHEKNGYAPDRDMLKVSTEFVDLLIQNGVIEELSLYEGGPPILVVLTEKGMRMSKEQR